MEASNAVRRSYADDLAADPSSPLHGHADLVSWALARTRVRRDERDDATSILAERFLRRFDARRSKRSTFIAWCALFAGTQIRRARMPAYMPVLEGDARTPERSSDHVDGAAIAARIDDLLSAEDAALVRAWFGLGTERRSLRTLAAAHGVTRQGVRHRIESALGRLRVALRQ